MFGFWSSSAGKSKELLVESREEGKPSEPSVNGDSPPVLPNPVEATKDVAVPPPSAPAQPSDTASSDGGPAPPPAPAPAAASDTNSTAAAPLETAPSPSSQKRFSWRVFVQPKGTHDRKAAPPSHREEAAKEAAARQEYLERKVRQTRSERRAREDALVVRELIVGSFATPSAAPPKSAKVFASAAPSAHAQKARKAKQRLLEPREAQRLIAQLRQLPSSDVPVVAGRTAAGEEVRVLPRGPIHAVCLSCPDEEAHEKHFAKLDRVGVPAPSPDTSPKAKQRSLDLSAVSSKAVDGIASVTTSSFEKIKAVLGDLDVVSLIAVPDLGIGQPVGSPGLLAGAVPTAKAVMQGVEELTPQLMTLGYATGKSIVPSHEGVYPPTDRMSVLTCKHAIISAFILLRLCIQIGGVWK